MRLRIVPRKSRLLRKLRVGVAKLPTTKRAASPLVPNTFQTLHALALGRFCGLDIAAEALQSVAVNHIGEAFDQPI